MDCNYYMVDNGYGNLCDSQGSCPQDWGLDLESARGQFKLVLILSLNGLGLSSLSLECALSVLVSVSTKTKNKFASGQQIIILNICTNVLGLCYVYVSLCFAAFYLLFKYDLHL